MNELSLFTGAGGGLLGTHLLGWKAIGYVEWNEYCQRVIRARIDDGILPVAPIFTDVREFVESGAAAEYRGFADVVTGGFPCQPFSVAGKQLGAADPRNMWPATIDVIRAVRPKFAFLENVPAILSSGYFGTILGDLAESGYNCRWRILSAAELGAPHIRNRLWIVALRTGDVADSQSKRWGMGYTIDVGTTQGESNASGYGCKVLAHANGGRFQKCDTGKRSIPEPHSQSADVAHANGAGCQQQRRFVADAEKYEATECRSWWEVEPDVGRVADGVASRVDRLRGIGNGQVPAVAAAAWRLLTADLFAAWGIRSFTF